MARCSNHPNVVKFVGACADNNQFWYVFVAVMLNVS
jgi:hypothetical protein